MTDYRTVATAGLRTKKGFFSEGGTGTEHLLIDQMGAMQYSSFPHYYYS